MFGLQLTLTLIIWPNNNKQNILIRSACNLWPLHHPLPIVFVMFNLSTKIDIQEHATFDLYAPSSDCIRQFKNKNGSTSRGQRLHVLINLKSIQLSFLIDKYNR
jgi:hypothetical protein